MGWAALVAAMLAAGPALAWTGEARPELLSVGVGYFDVLKNTPRDRAADFRLEYRFGGHDLGASTALRPFIGAEVTSDGGVYGLGGILLDVNLGPVSITPGFGVGAFNSGGGKDMGTLLEFRSSIEIAWRFGNESRIALALSHISNGDIVPTNPGAEILTLYWHQPIDW